jgi:hypothetical protein
MAPLSTYGLLLREQVVRITPCEFKSLLKYFSKRDADIIKLNPNSNLNRSSTLINADETRLGNGVFQENCGHAQCRERRSRTPSD